jgi:hypothetical protein
VAGVKRGTRFISATETRENAPVHDVFRGLVARFQHSHTIAADTFANVGIRGPLSKISMLVEFWI